MSKGIYHIKPKPGEYKSLCGISRDKLQFNSYTFLAWYLDNFNMNPLQGKTLCSKCKDKLPEYLLMSL